MCFSRSQVDNYLPIIIIIIIQPTDGRVTLQTYVSTRNTVDNSTLRPPDASNARRSMRCVRICPKMIYFMDLMVRRTKWLGKSHAILVTSCTECSTPIYVGETGDRVYARMQNHLSRIRTRNTADPVGHHFNTEIHSIENFRFTVIEKVRENNYFYRTARELFWMKKLKTTESPGINKKE